MYEEDMVGFHLFFANVVIDYFSLLNFSTYNLIKDHLLQGFREFESSQ